MKYSLISKYRSVLMGFATIWVAFLHAQMWFRNPILATFKWSGHNGVDVFLFLSGLGLYYAYQKTQGWKFISRRLLRILPIFIPVAIARIIYYHYSAKDAFYLLTTLSFWFTYDRSMWYVSMIVVLYFLTPLYMKYCFIGKEKKCTIFSIVILFLISFLFLNKQQLLFFARVPIFLLGIYFGYLSHQEETMHKQTQIVLFGSMIIGFIVEVYLHSMDVEDALMFGKGGFFYCGFFVIPGLCYGIAKIAEWLRSKNILFINHFLEAFGKISFPFYLLHEICIRYFSAIMNIIPPYNYNGILLNCMIILFTYILAYLLQTIMYFIMDKIGMRKQV